MRVLSVSLLKSQSRKILLYIIYVLLFYPIVIFDLDSSCILFNFIQTLRFVVYLYLCTKHMIMCFAHLV